MEIDPHILAFLRVALITIAVIFVILYFGSREHDEGEFDPEFEPEFDTQFDDDLESLMVDNTTPVEEDTPDDVENTVPAAPVTVTRRFVCYAPGTAPPALGTQFPPANPIN